jgi:hypothetical protein
MRKNMYSFHPFGGIETHPYGGSIGAFPSFDKLTAAADKFSTTATKAKKTASAIKKAGQSLSPDKKAKSKMSATIGTGASPRAFTPMQLNMANINSTLANYRKLAAVTPTFVAPEELYLEQPYMGEGGMSEGGFFETYKNYIIIGGAIAVVGAFALYMRNR